MPASPWYSLASGISNTDQTLKNHQSGKAFCLDCIHRYYGCELTWRHLALSPRGVLMTLFRTRAAIFIGVVLFAAFCSPVSAQQLRRGFTPTTDGARTVVAESGMAVAQEKSAAEIGADILRRGGNAVDAAVATGFAMAVT